MMSPTMNFSLTAAGAHIGASDKKWIVRESRNLGRVGQALAPSPIP
ncbi:MAG TPA: hypothetical protein VEX40_17920 [Mycobacterium sp.]|nr:hypothetical protein [Mycobacterium sp.]